MASRTVSAAVCLLLVCGALRQTPAPDAGTVPGWKSAAQADASVIRPSPGAPTAAPASAPAAAPAPAVSASLPAPSVHVTSGTGQLPNEHGQLWREYDLSSYTLRITNTRRPEQAIVDWILRETGYDAWTGETLAILNATPKTLRVYHTPPVQNVVAEIVERFVRNDPEPQSFGLRLITVDSPSWRAPRATAPHARADPNPGRSGLALGKRGGRHAAGRPPPPGRFPRAQRTRTLGQQRSGHGRLGRARPQLPARGGTPAGYLAGVRAPVRGGRRRLLPGIQPLALRRWPADRRRHQVRDRPDRETGARYVGRAHRCGTPPANEGRGAAMSLNSASTSDFAGRVTRCC